jgi:hypothetical protein
MQSGATHAAMVGTDQVLTTEKANIARDRVQTFMSRADVQQRLQGMGIKANVAKARVAALSDTEVAALADRIDKLPAGGNLGQTDLILILLIAILVVIAI